MGQFKPCIQVLGCLSSGRCSAEMEFLLSFQACKGPAVARAGKVP